MILKHTYILLFLLIISCKSTKNNNTETDMNTDTATNSKEMIADGYQKGVIVASKKDNDCAYVIKIEDGNNTNYLDPVDLPDEFKKDGVNIWFKYTLSRRPKRCDKADPVTLNSSTRLRN